MIKDRSKPSKAMIKIGLDGIGPEPDVKVSDSYETKLNYLNSLEPTYQIINSIFSSYKLPENVETKLKIIGDDGNEIKIYKQAQGRSTIFQLSFISMEEDGYAIATIQIIYTGGIN